MSLDFQAYTSGGSNFLAFTREVEFNVYVYPESRLPAVPLMSWQDYLRGRDQTKTIGGFRLHVPCDNPVAVQAGQQNFGEPKWLASFQYAVPSPNAPDVNTWSYGVYEPSDPTKTPPADTMIFEVDADLRGTPSVISNLSPLIEYGTRTIDGREVVAANFWNFFGWFDTYFFDEDAARKVKLHLGPSIDKHRLRQDVQIADRHDAADRRPDVLLGAGVERGAGLAGRPERLDAPAARRLRRPVRGADRLSASPSCSAPGWPRRTSTRFTAIVGESFAARLWIDRPRRRPRGPATTWRRSSNCASSTTPTSARRRAT